MRGLIGSESSLPLAIKIIVPSALPAVVGLGMVPSGIRRLFEALFAAGLSEPEFIGSGVGESFNIAVVGAAVSVLLCLVGLNLHRLNRRTRTPGGGR